MTGRNTVFLVVALFTLNVVTLVRMRLLPEEWIVAKHVLSEEADTEATLTEMGPMKEMVVGHYVRLYKEHATANTFASVVLLLDACFVFAVGVVLGTQREMKEVMTTEPPAEGDAEDRETQP